MRKARMGCGEKKGEVLRKAVSSCVTRVVTLRLRSSAIAARTGVARRNSCLTMRCGEAMQSCPACGHELCLLSQATERDEELSEMPEQCWCGTSFRIVGCCMGAVQVEHGNAEAANGRAKSVVTRSAIDFCFITAISRARSK